jgi:hypothetical protein
MESRALLVGGDKAAAHAALCGWSRGYPDAVLRSYGEGSFMRHLQYGLPVPYHEVRTAGMAIISQSTALSARAHHHKPSLSNKQARICKFGRICYHRRATGNPADCNRLHPVRDTICYSKKAASALCSAGCVI